MRRKDWSECTLAIMAGWMRYFLRQLWEYHHAPKLDTLIPKFKRPKPRNVTASREEVEAILAEARPALRLLLLMCSDLAIRSGTANQLSGEHYNQETGELRFSTKGGSHQTLPVTDEIKKIIDTLDTKTTIPFVWQLKNRQQKRGPQAKAYGKTWFNEELRQIEKKLHIKRIIPHDLRRTTAVAVYEETGDLRAVQQLLGHADLATTLMYIDHDAVKVKRSVLEIIKRPAWRKERTA
jgi:integrase/recombinase XerC